MKKEIKILGTGILLILLFAVWTLMIQVVDVRPAGQTRTEIGFASLNSWFFELTGVHLDIYHITDWLGLVPILICIMFGTIGLAQMITRKSLIKVDFDIIVLGFYYVIVILCYLLFEMHPINYRPIFMDGLKEASYPSSTSLLVISVMPTLVFNAERRLKSTKVKKTIGSITAVFTLSMVVGRTLSGVHWLTDIVGSALLGFGLFCVYKAIVLIYAKEK